MKLDEILGNFNFCYIQLATATSASEGLLFGKNLKCAMQSVDSVDELSQPLASCAPAAPSYDQILLKDSWLYKNECESHGHDQRFRVAVNNF